MTHVCALQALFEKRTPEERTLLVVGAHPDDETIGIGATLSALVASGWRVRVLHVTDGAPEKVSLRYDLAHLSREEAAAVRRKEIAGALRAGGLDPDQVLLPHLSIADQEAAPGMVRVARALVEQMESLGATVVVTHPYEGGHPDHDATALAVHAAIALSPTPIALGEMTSYHRANDSLVTGVFRTDAPQTACARRHPGQLDDASRARKRRMLDAFPTQAKILEPFHEEAEPLRCAPRYDFTKPPHEGTLHYQTLPFDWTPARFCELAEAALRDLGLKPPL